MAFFCFFDFDDTFGSEGFSVLIIVDVDVDVEVMSVLSLSS